MKISREGGGGGNNKLWLRVWVQCSKPECSGKLYSHLGYSGIIIQTLFKAEDKIVWETNIYDYLMFQKSS